MVKIATGPDVFGLWAGDANADGQVDVGAGISDRVSILNVLGLTTPGNILYGYYLEDVNFDGQVDAGAGISDRVTVLNVLGLSTPGNIFYQHMP
jgi:hypothetical protein